MRNLLKKYLPSKFNDSLKRLHLILDKKIAMLISKAPFLISVRYLVTRKFDREQKSVIAGRVEFYKRLNTINKSSALMRRNTHRLEKGLIMRPRKAVFAESFILETVELLIRSAEIDDFDAKERKWTHDVLEQYFSIVEDSAIIKKAKKLFECCEFKFKGNKKFTPYEWNDMPKSNINFSDLEKFIARRRSVRWYKNEPISEEVILKAVELAITAPSACNRQPFQIYVCNNKKNVFDIARCAGGTPGWAENIPNIAVLVGDLSCYPSEQDRHAIYIDSSLAAMQLMLAFEALGISTCPINWPDIERAEKKLAKLLRLEKYERPIMLISFGVPLSEGGIPFSQKKSPHAITKFI